MSPAIELYTTLPFVLVHPVRRLFVEFVERQSGTFKCNAKLQSCELQAMGMRNHSELLAAAYGYVYIQQGLNITEQGWRPFPKPTKMDHRQP